MMDCANSPEIGEIFTDVLRATGIILFKSVIPQLYLILYWERLYNRGTSIAAVFLIKCIVKLFYDKISMIKGKLSCLVLHTILFQYNI